VPEILEWRKAYKTVLISVKRGSILLMRPLLLHSSSVGTAPKNRRIVQLEFSAENLPNGLE
jgi:hypothetical protein